LDGTYLKTEDKEDTDLSRNRQLDGIYQKKRMTTEQQFKKEVCDALDKLGQLIISQVIKL
jgi:hypothetical protein